jgi:hypothetical protein
LRDDNEGRLVPAAPKIEVKVWRFAGGGHRGGG